MRRLLKFELKKVISKRLFWGFFLIAFLLNIFMLWWVNKGDVYTPNFGEYKALYNELRPLGNSEKLSFLQKEKGILDAIQQKENLEIDRANDPNSPFTKNDEQQYAAVYSQYKDILDQKQDYRQAERRSAVVNEAMSGLNTIMGYPAYLDGIRRNASLLQESSIFGAKNTNAFSSRNIQKTLTDYKLMSTIHPEYDIDRGVNLIVDFPATDIFLLLILLAVCLSLITDEKDKGLFALVKATKGGTGQTIAAKLMVLFTLILSVTALVFASTVLFAQESYGLGNLSRAVQSLPNMLSSTLPLNVGEYLLLFFVVKAFGLSIIGMIILLFALFARHPVLVVVETIAAASASICLFQFIPMTSDFNWLRVLNAVCLVNPNTVLTEYYNLNFLGQPVHMLSAFLVFMTALLILLIVTNSLVFIKKKELSSGRLPFKDILSRIKIFRPHVHLHFTWYEIKKIAGINLAALILVLFALFQWFSTKDAKITMTADDYYYRHYMVMLAGKLTPAKEALLQKEKTKFDAVHTEIQKIDDQYGAGTITWDEKISQENAYNGILTGEASFNQVYDRYDYIKAHPGTQFVYDLGYDRLFGVTDPDNGLSSGVRLMIGLILCLCGVFSMEYRTAMYKVLGTTEKGTKDTVLCKLVISLVISALLFGCAYLPDMIVIGKTYGFDGLKVSLSSLPPFEHFGHFSILGYIFLLFASRLMICFAIACIILALSLLLKNNVYTALVALGVLAGPPLLHMVGIHLFDHASLIPMLTTNTYYLCEQHVVASSIQVAAAVIFTLLCIFVLLKRFGKSDLSGIHILPIMKS